MFDFLKAVIEKLRMDLLLAALAISIFLFKVIGFDVWWMVFSFCIAYLILIGIEHWAKHIKTNIANEKKARLRSAEQEREDAFYKEEVWKRFFALDERSLQLVKEIYLSEKDPQNPLIRYVRDYGNIAFEIERSVDFRVSEGDRRYRPLLHAEIIANASVITFDPYYLALVEHFVKTGKKERV